MKNIFNNSFNCIICFQFYCAKYDLVQPSNFNALKQLRNAPPSNIIKTKSAKVNNELWFTSDLRLIKKLLVFLVLLKLNRLTRLNKIWNLPATIGIFNIINRKNGDNLGIFVMLLCIVICRCTLFVLFVVINAVVFLCYEVRQYLFESISELLLISLFYCWPLLI